jgi:hypothetical protein
VVSKPELVNKLKDTLLSINWTANINSFINDGSAIESVVSANYKTAIWARQFEIADKGNPALAFVREMQIASHNVCVLAGLSLYKPAAGAIRAMVESALYYSFFRMHLTELETLARGEG